MPKPRKTSKKQAVEQKEVDEAMSQALAPSAGGDDYQIGSAFEGGRFGDLDGVGNIPHDGPSIADQSTRPRLTRKRGYSQLQPMRSSKRLRGADPDAVEE